MDLFIASAREVLIRDGIDVMALRPKPLGVATAEVLVELQPHYFDPTATGITRSRVISAAYVSAALMSSDVNEG